MNPDTSLRMQAVQAPIVPVMTDLIRKNPGTISLGQGVAWYGPPEQAFECAVKEMRRPENQLYAPVEGIPELRNTLRDKLLVDNGIQVTDRMNLLVTAGANMGFLNAVMAITDPGDEIILLSPYYFNYEMTIRMLNCKVITVDTDENYHPDINLLADAISPGTRAIVTISPNNPTGAVYSRDELQAINNLCHDRGIYHISDEAYEYFNYTGEKHFSIASQDNSTNHTISLFSLSKSFGFAGWRIGYMLIPDRLSEAVLKVQDSNLICAPVVSQYAALGAVRVGREYCQARQDVIMKNRDRAITGLTALDLISGTVCAEGAFYLFLRINGKMSALELCRRLVEEFAVAVLPGTPFGNNEDCVIRLSYGALEPDRFELAMQRLTKGLTAIIEH